MFLESSQNDHPSSVAQQEAHAETRREFRYSMPSLLQAQEFQPIRSCFFHSCTIVLPPISRISKSTLSTAIGSSASIITMGARTVAHYLRGCKLMSCAVFASCWDRKTSHPAAQALGKSSSSSICVPEVSNDLMASYWTIGCLTQRYPVSAIHDKPLVVGG